MAELAELEAALAARWDREQLAVYGDYLQSIGDPRGELISIDLHAAAHGRSDELVERKRELVLAWLGEDLATIVAHTGAIDHAFVLLGHRAPSMAAFALDELLAHPAGRYLRRLQIDDTSERLADALRLLAETERPWLSWLRVPAWVGPRELERAVSAMPLLRELELGGQGVASKLSIPPHVRVSRPTS
jgi:hypothetical protein